MPPARKWPDGMNDDRRQEQIAEIADHRSQRQQGGAAEPPLAADLGGDCRLRRRIRRLWRLTSSAGKTRPKRPDRRPHSSPPRSRRQRNNPSRRHEAASRPARSGRLRLCGGAAQGDGRGGNHRQGGRGADRRGHDGEPRARSSRGSTACWPKGTLSWPARAPDAPRPRSRAITADLRDAERILDAHPDAARKRILPPRPT